MDSIYIKGFILALALCGAWFVFLTVKDGWAKIWPKIRTWWVGESTLIRSELDALKAEIAAIKAAVGIKV